MSRLISFMNLHILFMFFCCCLRHKNLVLILCRHSSALGNRHCFDQDRLHRKLSHLFKLFADFTVVVVWEIKIDVGSHSHKNIIQYNTIHSFCSSCFVRWNLICECYVCQEYFESFLQHMLKCKLSTLFPG